MPFCYFNEVNPNHLIRTGEQLWDHIFARQNKLFDIARAERDKITTPEQLAEYKAKQRAAFLESIGGLPDMSYPLNAKVTKTTEKNGYKVENIVFNSREGVYVTGNMYIPDGITGPTPAILFVSGHEGTARLAKIYQKCCQTFVKQGLIVFAFDPVGQGERISYYDEATGKSKIGGCTSEHDQAAMGANATGKFIARYFLADGIKALDYMATRPEIDMTRIGITGNSGGGTQTSVLMAMDDRIACAAPGTFISSRKRILDVGCSQDGEQIWPNCTVNGFDHISTIMMMAPKPVDILAVRYDFFPIEGAYETYEEAKHFYEMFGCEDSLRLSVDYDIHTYSDPLKEEAAAFFVKHLLGKDVIAGVPGDPIVPNEELYATPTGLTKTSYPDSVYMQDETAIIAEAQRKARLALPDAERLARAKKWLGEKVYAHRDYRKDGYFKWMPSETEKDEGCVCMTAMWLNQNDLYGFATVFTSEDTDPRLPRKTVFTVWDNGTKSAGDYEEYIKAKCGDGYRVVVLDLSGIGNLKQTPLGSLEKDPRTRDNSLFLLGNLMYCLDDSLCALRTFDVLRSLDILTNELGIAMEDVELFADGDYGIYGTMAAFLDRRISITYGDKIMHSFERERMVGYTKPYNDDFALAIPGMLEYFDYNEIM